MMIKKITLAIILLISMSITAQKSPKVDLDRFYFSVLHQILPSQNVPFENRTYTTNITLSNSVYDNYPDDEQIKGRLYIKGWKNVTENPTVTMNYTVSEFSLKSSNIVTRLVEEKDKAGKVIKSYNMYSAVAQFYGNGNVKISGPVSTTQVEPKKVEAVAKETNRFLQNKVAKTEEVAATGSNYTNSLAVNLEYKSGESENYKEIEKNYNLNKNEIFNQKLREFIDGSINSANYAVNKLYGFEQLLVSEKVWIMDAKDDEGVAQKEAITAVKVIFNEIQADKPIDDAIANLQPLVEYFESLKTKYPDDNKGSKKIRYSAYYNLGKIYLFTDQPEKAIKEGEGIIANDYDKSDGKDIIKEAEELIKIFTKTGFTSRHNPSLN